MTGCVFGQLITGNVISKEFLFCIFWNLTMQFYIINATVENICSNPFSYKIINKITTYKQKTNRNQ